MESGLVDGNAGSSKSWKFHAIYGNGTKCSGVFQQCGDKCDGKSDADVECKPEQCDDMCGAKRNIYGNGSKQLHVESGFFDGFAGGGKPHGDDDIHGSRSERKLHEQCNEDGNGGSGSDDKCESCKFYDMCGTECDADGNGSGQLYMESGIVDGFAGSSKSRKHYAIYSNRK